MWFVQSIKIILVVLNIFHLIEEGLGELCVRMLSKRVTLRMRFETLRKDFDFIFTIKLFKFPRCVTYDKLFSFNKCYGMNVYF